jgi:hypothetical protein
MNPENKRARALGMLRWSLFALLLAVCLAGYFRHGETAPIMVPIVTEGR